MRAGAPLAGPSLPDQEEAITLALELALDWPEDYARLADAAAGPDAMAQALAAPADGISLPPRLSQGPDNPAWRADVPAGVIATRHCSFFIRVSPGGGALAASPTLTRSFAHRSPGIPPAFGPGIRREEFLLAREWLGREETVILSFAVRNDALPDGTGLISIHFASCLDDRYMQISLLPGSLPL